MPGFLVCVPSTAVSASVAPCADAGGSFTVPAVIEFPAPGSVSFANADQLFAYGFSAIIFFWLLGVSLGAILSVIKRG